MNKAVTTPEEPRNHVGFIELVRCEWCMRRIANSEWEQMSITRGWLRLCSPCARKRLRNPYNALLDMRKITPTAQ